MGGCREAAEAWEAAFVDLAKGRLLRKATGGGLRLSFSAERSVADELARVGTALLAFATSRHLPTESSAADSTQVL